MTERPAWRIAVAFALGVASHVVLDAIPHGDYRPLARSTLIVVALCETIAVGALTAYLVRRRAMPRWKELFAAGFAGAALPDGKVLAALVLPQDAAGSVADYGDRMHAYFHAVPPAPATGWAIEITFTIVLLALLAWPLHARRADATVKTPGLPRSRA
ncbi:MAG: hypothetical protein ACRENU_07095 [Gemmatimonadaceae bacterium]